MTSPLEYRQTEFRAEPCSTTGRRYAAELFDCFTDETIGNDTMRAGFAEIGELLTGGACDLGGPAATGRRHRT